MGNSSLFRVNESAVFSWDHQFKIKSLKLSSIKADSMLRSLPSHNKLTRDTYSSYPFYTTVYLFSYKNLKSLGDKLFLLGGIFSQDLHVTRNNTTIGIEGEPFCVKQ